MTITQTQITASSLERHARKCKICNHKDCEDIELDFLHWHSPREICLDYKLGENCVLYRHAHATGLFDRRMLNLKFAVAHVIDNAETITPSGAVVLKAIQVCSQINDRGQWIETPRRIIHQVEHFHSSGALPPTQTEASTTGEAEPNEADAEISNRYWKRLENAATSTKQ